MDETTAKEVKLDVAREGNRIVIAVLLDDGDDAVIRFSLEIHTASVLMRGIEWLSMPIVYASGMVNAFDVKGRLE